MKRILAGILVLLLVLTLCACGREREAAAPQTLTVPGVDAATGAWIGQGGCYRLEPYEMPADAAGLFLYEGREYLVYNDWDSHRLCLEEETVYETENHILAARPADAGIWVGEEIRDGDDEYVRFTLLTGGGEEQASLLVKLAAESLYLNCSGSLRVYSPEGESLAVIPHEPWAGRLLRGGDGALYFVEQDGQGGIVSAIDVEGGAFRQLFTYDAGTLCTGDGAAPFLRIRAEGIDRVRLDGSASPLVIWAECGLGVSGLTEVEARPDGSFLLAGFADPMRLVPAEPSELRGRIRLTLGVLNFDYEGPRMDFAMMNANLVREVSAFNARSTDCYVELQDLNEGGTLSAEQARMKLNTRLLAGESPDMLVFDIWSLSPFPYVRKGLLRDLDAEFIAQDPDVAIEDIVIAPMVQKDLGGLYLLSDRFSIETRFGLQSRFGQVWGWDYDTYREIDRQTPQGSMVMYNLTREYFLRESASRFLRSAIDWRSGTCDFDNESFIKLLEACRDMRETPEDPNNMVFGMAADLMRGGYMVTSLSMLSTPAEFAQECRSIGEPISFIGFPTPDGSCGTDLSLGDAIGVLSGSEHPLECWQFLKYTLTQSESGMPAYRPLLEERIDQARHISDDSEPIPHAEQLRSPMTEQEIQGFYALLGQIEHTTLYDSNALEIIQEEFAAVLAGDKSPQEAAKLVQSRLSLYVAEQN